MSWLPSGDSAWLAAGSVCAFLLTFFGWLAGRRSGKHSKSKDE